MATVSHTAMDQFVPDYSSQFLSDLQGLLEKAGRFTGATSAAIAFVEGQELVTKVSMGDCAPDPGSRSPISGSFTGLCVQQHDVQRCDDASKDDRVDAGACQALGIASMVIVPISENSTVLGVLAAFSPKPNAFSPTHVALLRTIADIVIELRKRYPAEPHPAGLGSGIDSEPDAARVESPLVHSAPDLASSKITAPVVKAPPIMPPVSAAAPAFAPPPRVEAKSEPKAATAEKTDSVMNGIAKLQASMAAIPVTPEPKKAEPPAPPKVESTKQEGVRIVEAAPVPEKKPLGPVLVKPEVKPKAEPGVDLWKREPLLIKNAEEAEEYARVLPEPKKESDILSTAADIGFTPVIKEEKAETAPMFGYGYDGPRTKRGRSFPVVKGGVAVVALAAFALGATWFFRHNSPTAQAKAVQAAAASQDWTSTQTSQTTSAQGTSDVGSTRAASGPEIAMVLRKTDLKVAEGKKELKIPESEPVPDRTIILNGGTVPKRTVADVAPPKIAADGTSGVSNILSMVKPTTQPETEFRASSITSPVLIKQVAPQFPAFARQMHIQSDRVVLNGTVNKDGSVSNIKVIRGKQVFVGPAVNAVREWKYKPAMLNGETTTSTVEIVVNFIDR